MPHFNNPKIKIVKTIDTTKDSLILGPMQATRGSPLEDSPRPTITFQKAIPDPNKPPPLPKPPQTSKLFKAFKKGSK